MTDTTARLAREARALYDRLYRRSLAIPVTDPMFLRLARLMRRAALRCHRRNVTSGEGHGE